MFKRTIDDEPAQPAVLRSRCPDALCEHCAEPQRRHQSAPVVREALKRSMLGTLRQNFWPKAARLRTIEQRDRTHGRSTVPRPWRARPRLWDPETDLIYQNRAVELSRTATGQRALTWRQRGTKSYPAGSCMHVESAHVCPLISQCRDGVQVGLNGLAIGCLAGCGLAGCASFILTAA